MGLLSTRLLLLFVLFYSSFACAVTSVNLTAGWTLLGNSESTPVDVASKFGDPTKVTSVWKWDKLASKWIFYSPQLSASELAAYAQGKGFGVLTSIAPKEGFWVHAPVASTVEFPGTPTVAGASATTLMESDLQVGWNLLASADNKTPSQLQAALGASLTGASKAMNSAWAWDAPSAKWRLYAPSLEAQGTTALADYLSNNNYLPFSSPLAATDGFWLNIDPAETYLLKLQSNAAVYSNPPNKTLLTLSKSSHISKLFTYHWNNGNGTVPGTISLKNTATGAIVGTWNAVAMKGMDVATGASWSTISNGPPYLYWTVQPNIDLAAGTYEVVDSSPATWSYTLDTGSRGIAWVYGWPISERPEIVTATIGTNGGTMETANMKLVVPPGAVSQAVNISVQSTPANTGDTPLSDVFSITLQGSAGAAFDMLDFTQDLQIEIGLKSTLPAGSTEKYFLKISTGGGYSLIPATVTGNTLKATLPGNPVSRERTSRLAGKLALPAASVISDDSAVPKQAGLKNDGVYDLIALGRNEDESDHFKFYYKTTVNAEYIATSKADLEAYYKILEDYGFSWTAYKTCRYDETNGKPYKLPVYFEDTGGPGSFFGFDGGEYGGYLLQSPCNPRLSTYITMNTNPAAMAEDPMYLKQIRAHELFHFLQAIYMHNAERYKWIDEASSLWFAYTVADDVVDPVKCFSDTWSFYNFTARGLFNPLNSAIDATGDIASSHGYASTVFLLYADAKGYFDQKERILPLWEALRLGNGEVRAFFLLMKKIGGLAAAWSEYAEDYYSGADFSSNGIGIKGSGCIKNPTNLYNDERPFTYKEKKISTPFNYNRHINLYKFSAVPYMLMYNGKEEYTQDVVFEVKNLIQNQKALVYSYSDRAGRKKIGEITSGGPTSFTSKGSEMMGGKVISIILIDTNIPSELSPSTTTVDKTNTVEVKVYSAFQISSVDPASGVALDFVKINGNGFGATQESSTVTFKGIPLSNVSIGSWSDTLIMVQVPLGATTGDFVVTVNGVASNGVKFTINDCIYDPTTKLCWDIKTSQKTMNWDEAGVYCSGMDKRLPTVEELVSFGSEGFIQFSGNEGLAYGVSYDMRPRLLARGFEHTKGDYWSSSAYKPAYYPSYRWLVNFSAGNVYGFVTDNRNMVRCVRSGR